MYRKATYAVGGGNLCQATEQDGVTTVMTRENGRIVRRKITSGGKVFGLRAVSYGDAYFEFPCGRVEIVGEEINFESAFGA